MNKITILTYTVVTKVYSKYYFAKTATSPSFNCIIVVSLAN